jgi:hypothetical protein
MRTNLLNELTTGDGVCVNVRVILFNATFNNISVISWSVLLVDEFGVSGENH